MEDGSDNPLQWWNGTQKLIVRQSYGSVYMSPEIVDLNSFCHYSKLILWALELEPGLLPFTL